MRGVDWSGEIPSWPEAVRRAADEGEARTDRVLNVLVGVLVALLAVALGVTVFWLGGGLW